MALSITNKALIGGVSSITLSGIGYGAYSYTNATVSIKNALIKDRKTPLNLDSTDSKDVELLQELAKQYFTETPKGKTKIVGLALTKEDEIESLKKQCKKLFETNSSDKDYERKLREAEEWCTNENAPRKITSLLPSGKALLTTGDTDKWNEPWTKFRNEYQNTDPKEEWVISNWTGIKSQTTVQEPFKQKCTENGKLSIIPKKQQALLSKFVTYCTKDNG